MIIGADNDHRTISKAPQTFQYSRNFTAKHIRTKIVSVFSLDFFFCWRDEKRKSIIEENKCTYNVKFVEDEGKFVQWFVIGNI